MVLIRLSAIIFPSNVLQMGYLSNLIFLDIFKDEFAFDNAWGQHTFLNKCKFKGLVSKNPGFSSLTHPVKDALLLLENDRYTI
jgi:hypothetical protein